MSEFLYVFCHSSLTILLMSAILLVWKLSRARSRACSRGRGGELSLSVRVCVAGLLHACACAWLGCCVVAERGALSRACKEEVEQ